MKKYLLFAMAAIAALSLSGCGIVDKIEEKIEDQIVSGLDDVLDDLDIDLDDLDEDFDFDFDDDDDDDNDVAVRVPLPVNLKTWGGEYAATIDEIKGFEYDDEYSDATYIFFDNDDYKAAVQDINISAITSAYIDDPAEYFMESPKSFEEYTSEMEEYGDFTFSKVKTINVNGLEVSYFTCEYFAYSSYFYEAYAWTLGETGMYIEAELEGCVSDEIKKYDPKDEIAAVFSAISFDQSKGNDFDSDEYSYDDDDEYEYDDDEYEYDDDEYDYEDDVEDVVDNVANLFG